jgi:hypothetical protein
LLPDHKAVSSNIFSAPFCTFWHVYVLGGAYFVWPWKSRAPHRDIVTAQRGHWPLLIRVSSITWRGSKLYEASRNLNIGTRYVCTCVGAGSGMGGERRKPHVLLLCVPVIFLTCDMYKSSLRHIHDPVLSSLKMKGIFSFFFWRYYFAILIYSGTPDSVGIGFFYCVSHEPLFVFWYLEMVRHIFVGIQM